MREITLTRGHIAKVDDEDFEKLVAEGRWYADVWHGARIYASHRNKRTRKTEYMHRYILNHPDNDVDHINGDTLDNQKSNLRVCTRSENMLNSRNELNINNKSGTKGVYFETWYNGWKAEIRFRDRKYHLGVHKTIEQAIEARKNAEQRIAEGLLPK